MTVEDEDWGFFDENGDFVITADAPEHVKSFFDEDHRHAELVIQWGITLERAGHEPEDWELAEYQDLVDYHLSKQDEAVENGDIETAQEHQHYAQEFDRIASAYFRHISDGGGEADV